MELFGDVLEDWPCSFDDGGRGQEGKAKSEDLCLEAVELAGALDVSEQLERVEDASDGCAGEADGLGDLDNAASIVMAFEALYDPQSAGEGKNEIGVAGIACEFAAVVSSVGSGMTFGDWHPLSS